MIICYSKKFIVHHLEKTGGTTVEKSLQPYLALGDLYIRDWQYYVYENNRWLSEHSSSSDTYNFLKDDWKKFKKFSTVRNPVQIMQSMYAYAKWVYDNTPSNEVIPKGAATAYEWAKNNNLGTKGFVDKMFLENYSMSYPQVDRLDKILDDGLIVDLSKLNDSWYNITTHLGFSYRLPMVNKNILGSSSIEFDSVTEKRIKRWFEKDYDVLPKITGVKWK